MTITAKFKNDRVRLSQETMFSLDKDDVDSLLINYAGRIGTDTLSTVTVSQEDITAGTPSINTGGNSREATIAISGGQEGSIARIEVKATTTAGKVLTNLIRFRVKDYYGG